MTNKVFVIKEFEVERRSIPLAIQTYFWRQSSQFLKPKLNRRSCESASVSLQRLICENRVQDLQPSLANAVLSVPRWFFVQASLPHVLAGVSALMANRYELGLVERLGNAEREMLYTMHWILVEAFNHCEVAYEESLLYPLATVELFVHLLSPHAFKIRDNDLIFRLGNGITLWKPLWTYQSPELPPFATAVIFKDQESEEDSRASMSAEDGSPSVRSSIASGRSVRKSDLDPFGKKLFSPATFFDVAVIKCLCSTGLCEEGLTWILKYILAYLKREFLMQEDEIPEEHENGLETQVKILPSELKTDVAVAEETKSSNFMESSGVDEKSSDGGNKKEIPAFQKTSSEVQQPEEQQGQEKLQNGQRKGSGTKLRVRMDSPILSGHDGGKVFTPVVSSIRSSSPDPNENIHLIIPSTCGSSIEFSLTPVPPTSVTIVNETDNNKFPVKTTSIGPTVATPYASTPTSESQSVQNVAPLLETSAVGPELITVTAPSTPTDTSQESAGNMGEFQRDIAYVLEDDPEVNKCDEEISSILTSSDSNIESSVCVTPLSSYGDSNSPLRTSRVPLASPDVDTDVSLGSVSLISAESSATTNVTPMTISLNSDEVNFESHATIIAENSVNFIKGDSQAGKGFARKRRSSGAVGSNRSSFAKTEKYYVYPGAAEYITNDGRLSILVILQALHGVLRDNPTGCVCEEVLNILNCLMEINEKTVKRHRRSSWVSQDDRTVAETMVCGWKTPQSDSVLGRLRPSFYGRPPSFQSLVFGCIFKLVKALGCPLGCGESLCLSGDKLRSDSIATLEKIVETQQTAAESWITNYARLDPVEDVVDLLHALLGFCEEPEMSDEEDEGMPSKSGLFSTKAGVEGEVVGFLLKTLVSRTAETSLQSLASLTLYGELRQMLKFIKDVYGGIFWKVALSGLKDCAFKDNKKNTQVTHENKLEMLGTTGRPVEREVSFKGSSIITPKNVKKRFFHQRFCKGMDGSDVEGSAGASSGVSPKVTATGLSLEETLSPKTKRKIFSLGTWRKKNNQGSTADIDMEEDEMFEQTTDSSKDKTSSLKRTLLSKSQSSRRKLEEVFQLKANFRRKDPLQTPDTPEAAQGIDIFVQEVEKKPVDVSALRGGMVRLRFLGNALQPGCIPNPQIVASMLDLEAPVIARAALLLECAFFVHRCNSGDWPTWIRGSHPSVAHRARSKGPTPTTTRRSLAAMHEAGLLFHSWGVALGLKLEYMLAKKQNSTLASIQDESEKSFLAQLREQMDEDYLDEATIHEHNKVCPYALKMIACHLLLEITAFLRESHGLYSVTKDNTRILQHRAAQSRKSITFPEKRRTLHMGSEQNRLSAFFGGGDKFRKASIWSQTSTTTATEMSTSPAGRYSHYEPPTITVSDQGVGESGLTIPMRKRSVEERMDRVAEGLPRNRGSLFVPRAAGSISGHYSPRVTRSPKFPISGGDGDAARFKTRKGASTKKQRTTTESTVGGGSESEDEDERKHFPWMNAIVLLNSSTIFLCGHQENCPHNCHFRQTQSCRRLLRALRTVYSDPSETHQEKEKVVDFSRGASRNIVHSGAPHLGLSQHASPKLERRKEKKDRADESMLEYMSAKLSSLSHIPFSVIAKAGVVVDRELLIDTLPVVWEVLLDGDQHLVSAAAAVFLLTGIRLPDIVEQLLFKELTCNDPGDRAKSLIRYEVLWQSRYHAWPRLEECAKQLLKLPPPRLDFTQPSPPVGVAVPHAPNSPWDANMILEEQQGKKNKDKRKVKEADLEEERRKQRSGFPLRTVPVALEATVAANVSTDEAGAPIPQSEERELWPSSLSSAVPHIIKLLDDVLVDSDKVAVMDGAYRVIWNCLVDNPILFFRTILEHITKKDKQEEQIILLRKLSLFLPEMPPGAAKFVFNSLVGVVMFYARTRKPGNKDPVALVLSLLWELAPSVKGLYFKDLKQCLKKEHCDASLMISANVPGTKKLAVTYTGDDTALERIPVHDEMTFGKVLQYYKARLNLDATDLVLIDKQSNMMMEEEQFVRDVYSHRKGFPSPHLKLEHMAADKAFYKRQQQAFTFKLGDIGRILLSTSILKTLSDQKHIWFLHGEFSRQISFPRNALHCDFHLYVGGTKGKELFALDVIHKGLWVKLVAILFQHMSSTFQWGSADLQLFLNVINGATLLHCEDGAVLRLCLVSFINIAIHFNQIFATDGYQYIFPTLLQVYAHHQTNEMVCQAIEFVVSQFYILHQKPCLLQLFASVAPHLILENRNDIESERENEQEGKVPPRVLFKLLLSLDRTTPDVLEVMDWVRAEKPLKPIDSCYEGKLDSPEESKVDIAIRLCVTVVDYAPDSKRASQMVIVMSAILPYYLEHLKQESVVSENAEKIQAEVEAITSLATSMQVLIKSSDILTRSFTHFQTYKTMSDMERSTVPQESFGSTGSLLFSRGSVSSYDLGNDEEEEAKAHRPLVERIRSLEEKDEIMEALYEYRKPRNSLLILVSDYVSICTRRVQELKRTVTPRFVSLPELLDDISIGVLAEIVYSLMKLAIYDPITMSCSGIQRYLLEALPVIDWAPEAVEPGINLILKRMNKIFTKLVNKPELMRNIDWHALEVYLRGVYLALCRQSFVANSQYLKSLVSTCMSMVLQERPSTATSISASLPWCPFFEPPKFFSATVVKLSARLMCSLRDACTLKEVCGGSTTFGGPSRTEKVFLRVLLPLLVRLGTGKYDTPKMSPKDLFYALSCFLRVITTKNSSSPGSPPTRLSLADDDIDLTRPLTFVSPDLTGVSVDSIPDSLYTAAYLGIKLLMVNFEDLMAAEYYRIFQAIEKVVDNNMGRLPFWDFVYFTVSHRTPLFLMLVPHIHTKIMAVSHNTGAEITLKQRILEKVQTPQMEVCCRKAFTERFLDELAALRENRALLEKEEDRPYLKPLTLNPPPRGRLDSEHKTGTPKTSTSDEHDAADEEKPGEIKQQDSLKIKKTVTFSQKPHESSSVDPKSPKGSPRGSPRGSPGGTEKRRKRLLFKQRPFESSVEQGGKSSTMDSLDSPFGHQRGTTMRGKPKLPSRGPYKIGARFKRGAAACVASGKEGSEEEPRPDTALLRRSGDVVVEMKEIIDGEAAPAPREGVDGEVASAEVNLALPIAEKTETKTALELEVQEMKNSELKQQIFDHTENKLNGEDEKSKSYTDIVALIETSYRDTPPNEHGASDAAGLTYKDVQMSMGRLVTRTQSKKSTDSDRSVDSETRLLDSPQESRRTSNGPAVPSRLSLSSSFVSDKSDISTNRLRPWHRLYSSGDMWKTKLSSGPSTSSEDCTSEDLGLDYVPPNRYIAVKLSPETDV